MLYSCQNPGFDKGTAEVYDNTAFGDLSLNNQAGALVEAGLSLRHGQVIEPELVVQWLVDNGFERVDQVDVSGQFARRGAGEAAVETVEVAGAQVVGQDENDVGSRCGHTHSVPSGAA